MSGSDETYPTLLFTPDNPCNTTIIDAADNSVLYQVKTELVNRSKFTTVYDAHGAVVASLEWRATLPDKVTIGNGQPTSITNWLKKRPFSDKMSFRDGDNCEYTWIRFAPIRSLELHTRGAKLPIAQYTRTAEGERGSMRAVGRLSLLPRAVRMQDLVVTSLLFCEKKFFVKYNSQVNATAMTGIMLGEMIKS